MSITDYKPYQPISDTYGAIEQNYAKRHDVKPTVRTFAEIERRIETMKKQAYFNLLIGVGACSFIAGFLAMAILDKVM